MTTQIHFITFRELFRIFSIRIFRIINHAKTFYIRKTSLLNRSLRLCKILCNRSFKKIYLAIHFSSWIWGPNRNQFWPIFKENSHQESCPKLCDHCIYENIILMPFSIDTKIQGGTRENAIFFFFLAANKMNTYGLKLNGFRLCPLVNNCVVFVIIK